MDIQPPSLRAKRSNPARCVGIEPRHLSLLELEARDCRYPYGGDRDGEAITFCGHLRREDSSYCAAHFHLTRNVESAPERSAGDRRICRATPRWRR
jgi:GcrA cell cycle regulator